MPEFLPQELKLRDETKKNRILLRVEMYGSYVKDPAGRGGAVVVSSVSNETPLVLQNKNSLNRRTGRRALTIHLTSTPRRNFPGKVENFSSPMNPASSQTEDITDRSLQDCDKATPDFSQI